MKTVALALMLGCGIGCAADSAQVTGAEPSREPVKDTAQLSQAVRVDPYFTPTDRVARNHIVTVNKFVWCAVRVVRYTRFNFQEELRMNARTMSLLIVLSGSSAGVISCTNSEPAKPAAVAAVAMCVSGTAGTCTPAPEVGSALVFAPPTVIAPASPASPAPAAAAATPAPAAAGPTLLPGGFGFAAPPRSSFNKAMGDIGQVDANLIEIEKAGWVASKTFANPAAEAGKLIDLFRNLEQGDKAKSKPAEFKEFLKRSADHATTLRDMLATGNVDVKKASATLAAIGTTCNECHSKYQN